jgi:hypothetical protein
MRRVLLIALSCALFSVSVSAQTTVTLAWNQNSETDIAGYTAYEGTAAPYVAKLSISQRGQHIVRAELRDGVGNMGAQSQTVTR